MAIYKALTIAGSDSGAGAGIQADLKTFAAFEVYGTSVITAVTAQNTTGVTQILEMPPELIAAQIDAVIQDIGAQALKTGMLANTAIIKVVAHKIQYHHLDNIVVDPVMVAKGGDLLLRPEAIDAFRNYLIPLATVVTPNLPEAQKLTGIQGTRKEDIKEAARRLIAMGAGSVLIKGGHRRGPATDIFYDGKGFREFRAERIPTPHTHGTGCTLSAAIAAGLAKGISVNRAIGQAKTYITRAIRKGFSIGAGHSPVHHLYSFWNKKSY